MLLFMLFQQIKRNKNLAVLKQNTKRSLMYNSLTIIPHKPGRGFMLLFCFSPCVFISMTMRRGWWFKNMCESKDGLQTT